MGLSWPKLSPFKFEIGFIKFKKLIKLLKFTLKNSISCLGMVKSSYIFKWARPTSIYGFSGCACVRACVRVRKLSEAELTMTIKVKVVSLDE